MRATIQKYLRIPFVRDLATLQVGQTIGTLCGFLSSILFARLLGLEGFGQYAVVLAFTGLFGLVTNLGQGATAVTFLAEALGRKDWQKWSESLWYYTVLSAVTGVVLAMLMIVLPACTQWLYSSRVPGELARLVFLSAIIDPIFAGIMIVLQTVREMRLLTLLENARVTVQLGLSVLFLLLGHGVAGILMGSLLGTALFALIAAALYPTVCRRHGLPSFARTLRERGQVWHYVKDGAWIAVDKNVGNLYPNLFLFIASLQVPEAVVGLLRLGFKLGNLPASFILSNVSRMAATVIPTLAGAGSTIRGSLIRLGLHAGALHVGASLTAAIVIPPLLVPVYGEAFRVTLYPFLAVLLIHLALPLHAMITPVLRLKSRTYLATAFNTTGLLLGSLVFLVLAETVRPTVGFYAALATFHLCAAAVVFPIARLLGANHSVTSSARMEEHSPRL